MKDREQLEQEIDSAIEDGAKAFVRLGNALTEIRDFKLYKDAGYTRFEDYTQARWGFTRIRAYQLIDASFVYGYLSKAGFEKKDLPKGESALRGLGKLSQEQCVELWRQALARSPKPSRALVSELAKNFLQKNGEDITGSMIRGLQEDVNDPGSQLELKSWDTVVADGVK